MREIHRQEVIDLIDTIAREWDGCEYDAPGEAIDIGDAIRTAGFRRVHALFDAAAPGRGTPERAGGSPRSSHIRAGEAVMLPAFPARTGRSHELKTDPDVFDAAAAGHKTHEIRFNDRGFAVGDELVLRRTRYTGKEMREHGYPLQFVGEPLRRIVTHVLEGYGLAPGWVILSTAPSSVPTCSAGLTDRQVDAILAEFMWGGDVDLMQGHAAIVSEQRRRVRDLIAKAAPTVGEPDLKGPSCEGRPT